MQSIEPFLFCSIVGKAPVTDHNGQGDLIISTGHSGPQLGASGRLYQQSSVSGMIGYLSVQQAAGTQVCLRVPEAFMMPLQPQAWMDRCALARYPAAALPAHRL